MDNVIFVICLRSPRLHSWHPIHFIHPAKNFCICVFMIATPSPSINIKASPSLYPQEKCKIWYLHPSIVESCQQHFHQHLLGNRNCDKLNTGQVSQGRGVLKFDAASRLPLRKLKIAGSVLFWLSWIIAKLKQLSFQYIHSLTMSLSIIAALAQKSLIFLSI